MPKITARKIRWVAKPVDERRQERPWKVLFKDLEIELEPSDVRLGHQRGNFTRDYSVICSPEWQSQVGTKNPWFCLWSPVLSSRLPAPDGAPHFPLTSFCNRSHLFSTNHGVAVGSEFLLYLPKIGDPNPESPHQVTIFVNTETLPIGDMRLLFLGTELPRLSSIKV